MYAKVAVDSAGVAGMKIKYILVALAFVALCVAAVFFTTNRPETTLPGDGGDASPPVQDGGRRRQIEIPESGPTHAAPEGASSGESNEAGQSEEGDSATTEEERLVEAFDAATDKWMDAEKTKPPEMQDVYDFLDAFKKVPLERREECLHRALNLVPDENIMLLVGILMDKTMDKELVELVYNDVLNRSETVKKPILRQIFADKEHPCWADTAWILDVTGDVPKK